MRRGSLPQSQPQTVPQSRRARSEMVSFDEAKLFHPDLLAADRACGLLHPLLSLFRSPEPGLSSRGQRDGPKAAGGVKRAVKRGAWLGRKGAVASLPARPSVRGRPSWRRTTAGGRAEDSDRFVIRDTITTIHHFQLLLTESISSL